jgi:hypothetical protein
MVPLELDLLALKEFFMELKTNMDNILEGYDSVFQASQAASGAKMLNRRSSELSP